MVKIKDSNFCKENSSQMSQNNYQVVVIFYAKILCYTEANSIFFKQRIVFGNPVCL